MNDNKNQQDRVQDQPPENNDKENQLNQSANKKKSIQDYPEEQNTG